MAGTLRSSPPVSIARLTENAGSAASLPDHSPRPTTPPDDRGTHHTTMPPDQRDASQSVDPIAAIAALALPGLGHAIRGQVQRGVMIGVGVLGLFFFGLLIGGIASIDSTSDRTETRITYWLGMSWVGPVAWGTNALHQNLFKLHATPPTGGATIHITPMPDEVIDNGSLRKRTDTDPRPPTRSVGRMHELGVLCGLLAGMLNLVAILDALMPPAWRRSRQDRKQAAPTTPNASRQPPADTQAAPSAIDRMLAREAEKANTSDTPNDGGQR